MLWLFIFRIWNCYLSFALRNVWKIIPSFRVSNRWNSNGPCFLTINTLKRWIPDFYLLIRCICRRRYAHCSNQNNSVQNLDPYRYVFVFYSVLFFVFFFFLFSSYLETIIKKLHIVKYCAFWLILSKFKQFTKFGLLQSLTSSW